MELPEPPFTKRLSLGTNGCKEVANGYGKASWGVIPRVFGDSLAPHWNGV